MTDFMVLSTIFQYVNGCPGRRLTPARAINVRSGPVPRARRGVIQVRQPGGQGRHGQVPRQGIGELKAGQGLLVDRRQAEVVAQLARRPARTCPAAGRPEPDRLRSATRCAASASAPSVACSVAFTRYPAHVHQRRSSVAPADHRARHRAPARCRRCAARPGSRRRARVSATGGSGTEQHVPHGPGDLERQPADPVRPATGPVRPALGRLDEAAPALPVRPGDPPGPPAEQQQPRAVHPVDEQRAGRSGRSHRGRAAR